MIVARLVFCGNLEDFLQFQYKMLLRFFEYEYSDVPV